MFLRVALFSLVATTAPADPYETVITGSRASRTADEEVVATEVIGRREIEASGARDLADLLRAKAGLDVVETQFGAGVRLQGLDPEHVLILLDGQRLPGRTGGVYDLSRLSLEDVERVEIVKGPASALWGSDAMGGVIHVITRRAGRPFEAEAEARGGERGLLEVGGSVATASGGSLLRLSGGHRRHDSFQLESGPGTTGSEEGAWNADLRGEHRFERGTLLVGTLHYALRDLEGVDVGSGAALFDRTQREESFAASIAPEIPTAGGKLRLGGQYAIHGAQLLQDQRGSSALDQYQETSEQLWQLSALHEQPFGKSHVVTFGAELLLEQLSSPRLRSDGDRQRPSLFAQYEWRILDTVTLAPGARVDFDSRFGTWWSPKLATRWKPWEPLVLRASYGWGYRAPSFTELLIEFENPTAGYRVEGNPALQPESSRGATVGASWIASEWLTLDLGLFRNDLSGLIATTTLIEAQAGSPRVFGYVNVDEALTQGLEASASTRPLPGLHCDMAYAFTDARDLSLDQPLEGRARHRISGTVGWRERSWGTELDLRGALVGPRPLLVDGALADAPAYLDAGFHARQQLAESVAFLAGVDNLFDAGDPRDLPVAPRTFYAGISARY